MHLVPSAQGTVAAWRVGDGPAVLLVHGWEDDNSLWAPLIDALVARGRSVVVFDLPGHGRSQGEWGLGAQAADGILAVCASLGPVDAAVSHSMSAGGVVIAVTEGLELQRCVFIAPPLRGGGRGERWRRYAERLGVSDVIAEAAQRLYEERVGPARAAFDFRAALEQLDSELLFVHSRDDERNPYADSAVVVPRCRQAQLITVSGLTHRRTARDPEVVAHVAAFVTPGAS